MRPSLLAALVLWSACDGDAVELPVDAARPAIPSATIPVASASRPAPEPSVDPAAEAPPDPAPPSAHVSRAPQRYIRRRITPLLQGRALAHRVYQAAFGPSTITGEPTAVVLSRGARPGEPAQVAGFAHSGRTRFDFPPLHDGDALDRVAAVMFHDIDADPDLELVILIAYAEEDPEAPPYFSNVVLDWDAPRGRFVRLEQLEGEVEAFRTAGEVLAHLRRLNPP